MDCATIPGDAVPAVEIVCDSVGAVAFMPCARFWQIDWVVDAEA